MKDASPRKALGGDDMPRIRRDGDISGDVTPTGAKRRGRPPKPKLNGSGGPDEVDELLDYEHPPEPAATAIALEDNPEAEHLYQDVKAMELEAMQDPDPEDVLGQAPLEEDIEELIPPARSPSDPFHEVGDDAALAVPEEAVAALRRSRMPRQASDEEMALEEEE